MANLEKARLYEIVKDGPNPTVGKPIPVQFNPSSLKLTLTNTTEGGKSKGRQKRQFLGTSSTTLALDLIFDTADEGPAEKPRSVREKTASVERFVVAKVEGEEKKAPPKVRFHWGEFILDGVIDSITIDFDLFSAEGVPLRAKVGVQIKEQNARYQFVATDANAGSRGTPPNAGSAAAAALPGGGASGTGNRTGTALGGESAADFAARMGLDPQAWRGVASQLGGTLSLEAGAAIDFDTNLSLSAGLGARAGFAVDVSASLDVSLGMTVGGTAVASGSTAVAGTSGSGATRPPNDAAPSPRESGLAISAAGGVGAAISQVKTSRSSAAVGATRAAFGVTPAGGAPTPASASASRGDLGGTNRTPVTTDERATTFGAGVPLRARAGGAADERTGKLRGGLALHPTARRDDVVRSPDPSTPPWVALPPVTAPGGRAGPMSRARSAHPCGCGGESRPVASSTASTRGGCGCGGGKR